MPLFESTSCSVDYLVASIDHGSLGLPDIQRPFVWNDTQVRDLFDSMFRGYPVGFLLFWDTPNTPKAHTIGANIGSFESPSMLIIDGQQRLTSLYAVIKGKTVLKSNFKKREICIAFKPETGEFAVATPALSKTPEWIPNISELFAQSGGSYVHTNTVLAKLREARGEINDEQQKKIPENIERLLKIKDYQFSALRIDKNTDEELVSDIFVRVNSKGQKLTQSDFILTLMSVFWEEGRRNLEDFCRLSRVPSDKNDTPFNYFIKPDPDHLVRVAIGFGFERARLKYGYQILRGKDLESGLVSKELREKQFNVYKEAQGIALKLQNWKDFMRCLYSAGYRSEKMVTSQLGLIFAYTFYLIGKYRYEVSGDDLRKIIAKWFFMTALTGRYTSSPESRMEQDLADLRNVNSGDAFISHLNKTIQSHFTDDYWHITLPNELSSSSARSPSLFGYFASLVLLDARVLLSDLKVSDMLDRTMRGSKEALEKHHLFPKGYLALIGIRDDRDRNQIANFALIEWDRNNAISDEAPGVYFPKFENQMVKNKTYQIDMKLHALPIGWERMKYHDFLEERRKLMSLVIREAFLSL